MEARKRLKGDYRRWERSRSMELWQMDIVGGVRLVDGSEAGLKTDRTASVVIRGHAIMQNLRRGHPQLGVDARCRHLRVAAPFYELISVI